MKSTRLFGIMIIIGLACLRAYWRVTRATTPPQGKAAVSQPAPDYLSGKASR